MADASKDDLTDHPQQDEDSTPEENGTTTLECDDENRVECRFLNINDMQESTDASSWWDTADDANLFQRGNRPMYSAHWSVAWSDLMMTMFILFLVMYVYKTTGHDFLSASNAGKQAIIKSANSPILEGGLGNGRSGKSQEEISQSFSRLYDFSQLVINQNSLRDFAAIDLTPDKTIRIILTGDLLFDAARAVLKPAAQSSLRKIATIISDTPYHVNVVGYTDDRPINSAMFPSNWELSAARAGAVARFLIAATKLPPLNFEISGRASYHPIASNDSAENRARNRRVEIILARNGAPAKQFSGDIMSLRQSP
jgi:chemotaxis protein MotB